MRSIKMTILQTSGPYLCCVSFLYWTRLFFDSTNNYSLSIFEGNSNTNSSNSFDSSNQNVPSLFRGVIETLKVSFFVMFNFILSSIFSKVLLKPRFYHRLISCCCFFSQKKNYLDSTPVNISYRLRNFFTRKKSQLDQLRNFSENIFFSSLQSSFCRIRSYHVDH